MLVCLLFSLLCLFSIVPVGVFGDDVAVNVCYWESPPPNKQSFNFEPLSFKSESAYKGHEGWGGWWSETCTTDNCPSKTADQYEYLFNICAPTLQKPNVTKCGALDVPNVSAYQYNVSGDACAAIGQSAKDHQYIQLLVPGKPSQGYTLRYVSDSTCRDGEPRQLSVNVRCSANLPAQPQLNYDNNNKLKKTVSQSTCDTFTADCDIDTGDVEEKSKCHYYVNLDTVFGCPQSCLADNKPCSNHGICAEDTEANVTRCFCDTGYAGDKCQLTVDDSSSTSSRNPDTVLAVFVLILLFATLGLGYALYRKIRGFHGDYDHQYGQLSDGAKQGRGMSVNA